MKKIVLMMSAALMMAPLAFAEQLDLPYETEDGAMNSVELQNLRGDRRGDRRGDHRDERGDEIASGIINIIGAIAAERFHDNDRRYHGREYTCFARNGRGEVFRARGYRARAVQARAVDKCYRQSRVCRPLGCRNR